MEISSLLSSAQQDMLFSVNRGIIRAKLCDSDPMTPETWGVRKIPTPISYRGHTIKVTQFSYMVI